MNGFVVLFMGDCDDIPVAVLDNRDEAESLAKEIGEAEADDGQHHERVEKSLRVMSRDMGTFVGVAVATFVGGVMAAYDLVYDPEKTFDETD